MISAAALVMVLVERMYHERIFSNDADEINNSCVMEYMLLLNKEKFYT